MRKTAFNLLVLFILVLFIASCAPSQNNEAGRSNGSSIDSSAAFGSIALDIKWPEDTLPRSERVMYNAPPGVYTIRITISGPNILHDIMRTFSVVPSQPGQGVIDNVPVGTCIVFVDGLDSGGSLSYSGWVSGVSVTANQPATPSTVVMSPDDYPDNLPNAAALTLGTPESGTIDVSVDVDYFKFTAQSGYDYVIAASGTSLGMDTEITLYNSSRTEVANNDDISYPTNLDSQIDLTNASSGTYYVAVIYSDSGTQDVGDYEILVTQSGGAIDTAAPQSPAVVINGGAASTIYPDVTLSLEATDDVGVTAYYVVDTTSSILPSAPAASGPGWVAVSSTAGYSADESYTLQGSYSAGQVVYVYAWFKDAAGNVSAGAPDSITVNAPAAPTNVSTSAGDRQVNVTWTAVSGATGYNLYWAATSGLTQYTGNWIGGVTSGYTHSGLTNDVPYYYIVTAENDFGESADSAEASATPTTPYGWSNTDNMNQVRYRHTATVLNDGKLLVTGGDVWNGSFAVALSSCEIYDPTQNTWSTASPLSEARARHSAMLLSNGKVLVTGGEYHNGSAYFPVSSCEIYDPTQNTWSAVNPLNQIRSHQTGTLLADGRILVAGGWDGSNDLTSCEIYDPTQNTWTTVNPMSQIRRKHTATLLTDGRVLVTGGEYYSGSYIPLSSCEIYDPVQNTWSPANSMSQSRYWHEAILLKDGQVLVAGGHDGSVTLSSCEIYNPTQNTWSPINPMNQNRYGYQGTLLNDGRVMVVAGNVYDTITNNTVVGCEVYDPTSGMWNTVNSLNQERAAHTVTLLAAGRILIAGGIEFPSEITLSSCEIYSYNIPTDTTAPTGGGLDPVISQTDVSVNTDIYFEVNDPLPVSGSFYGVDRSTLTVTVEGGNAILNGVFQTGFDGVIIPDGIGGFYVTIDPGTDFNYGQVVNVTVDASDLAPTPNPLTQVVYSFTCVEAEWSATGVLTDSRRNHSATLLADGRVLVSGGYASTGYRSSCEIYDPGTGTWSTTGSLNEARREHKAVLLGNGNVLVAGGYNHLTTYYLSSCEVYNTSVGSWSGTGSLNTGRYNHTMTLLTDGQVLVTGGAYYSGAWIYLSANELHDPDTGLWSAAGSLNEGRRHHTATLLSDGRVLVTGGYNSASGWLASCEIYDPDTDTWSATGTLNTAREKHTATLLSDGKVLVASGYNSSGLYLTSCEVYDPDTGVWTPAGSLSTVGRRWHTATLLSDGRVLLTGGHDGTNYLSGCEVYDPSNGNWSATDDLYTDLSLHTAVLLNTGDVLVAGGFSGTTSYESSSVLYNYNIPADNTAPAVSGQDPPDGQFGVDRDTYIYFEIQDPLGSGEGRYGVDRSTLRVQVNGSSAFSGGSFQGSFSGAVVPDGRGGFHITINNLFLYGAGSVVTVTIDAQDLAPTPNTMSQVSYSFICLGSDQWYATTGSLVTDRYNHTVTRLDDGSVLAAGGYIEIGGSTYVMKLSEFYNPATENWIALADMNVFRANHTATVLPDGRVLIAGGDQISTSIVDCETFDTTNGWVTTGSLVRARAYHTTTLLDTGDVLVVGGTNAFGSENSYELYDTTLGTWSRTVVAWPREQHTATRLNDGTVLITGGYDGANAVSTCYIYNPIADTWSATTGSLNAARYEHTATLLDDGKVLVAGGYNGTSYLDSFEVYDPGSGTFTSGGVNTMGAVKAGHSATLLNDGRVVVAGGYNSIGTFISSELFDPTSVTFSGAANLSDDKCWHKSVLLNDGRVLLTGGYSWSVTQYISLAQCELYEP